MGIELNFVNNSGGSPEIVVFQKNTATALKVIKDLEPGHSRVFTFPTELKIDLSDEEDTFAPEMPIEIGQMVHVSMNESDDVLIRKLDAPKPGDIEVVNDLKNFSINAAISLSGKVLDLKEIIAPGQKAVFQFKPVMVVGIAQNAEIGNALSDDVLPKINCEFPLSGIASADIVMTGGGGGSGAGKYEFRLEKVVGV